MLRASTGQGYQEPELCGREQYRVKISNRFATLENVDDDDDDDDDGKLLITENMEAPTT
jgi:hypothetical protein